MNSLINQFDKLNVNINKYNIFIAVLYKAKLNYDIMYNDPSGDMACDLANELQISMHSTSFLIKNVLSSYSLSQSDEFILSIIEPSNIVHISTINLSDNYKVVFVYLAGQEFYINSGYSWMSVIDLHTSHFNYKNVLSLHKRGYNKHINNNLKAFNYITREYIDIPISILYDDLVKYETQK